MPKWLWIIVGFSVVGFLAGILGISWLIYKDVHKTILDVDSLIVTTSDNINRPCGVKGKPCGTIADVNQTLGTFRKTAGQVEVAARHENKNLTTLDAQEEDLFSKTNDLLGKANDTVSNTNIAVTKLFPVENNLLTVTGNASDAILSLKNSSDSLNQFLKSKYLNESIKNLDGISGNMNQLTGDISKKTHEFLYPAPCKGKLCWLKRGYTILKDVGPLSEPFYFGVESYKSIKGNP